MRKPPVLMIAAIQLLVILLAAWLLFYWRDKVTALSVLLGGALCVLPNTYFGMRAFQGDRTQRGARATQRVVESFYRAESGKFVLTLVGFATVFTVVRPLNAAALFISYSLCVMLQWLLVARLLK